MVFAIGLSTALISPKISATTMSVRILLTALCVCKWMPGITSVATQTATAVMTSLSRILMAPSCQLTGPLGAHWSINHKARTAEPGRPRLEAAGSGMATFVVRRRGAGAERSREASQGRRLAAGRANACHGVCGGVADAVRLDSAESKP